MTERQRLLAGAAALLVVPATIAFALATRHGLALDGDAATYLDLARSIRLGDGPTLTGFGAFEPTPSTHFPPLFPAWLAAVGTARWGNWLLLITSCVLMVAAVMRTTVLWDMRSFTSAIVALMAAIGVTCVALHPDAQATFAAVGSEALFVPLMLGAVLATLARRPWWVAGLVALALLTRHVGIALLVLPIFAAERRWWSVGLLASAAAALPYLTWRWWVAWQGVPPDRIGRWHGLTRWDLGDSLQTFARWILPTPHDVPINGFWLAMGFLVFATFGYLCWSRRELIALIAAYLAVVLVAKATVDQHIPLGGRIWFPLLFLLPIAVSARTFHRIEQRRRKRQRLLDDGQYDDVYESLTADHARGDVEPSKLAKPFLSIVLMSMMAALLGGIVFTLDRFRHGAGYASPDWTTSPTLAWVEQQPTSTTIRSDAADSIHVLLRRPAMFLPKSRFETAGRPNTRRFDQLRDLRGSGATFVFFTSVDRDYFVTAEDVRRLLDVEEVARFDDGFVLREVAFSR
ncbi:MAG: hypothetical protein AAGI46_02005 [Planctomycetota bacterium]